MGDERQQIDELKNQWNAALREIFDRTCSELGQSVPELTNDELTNKIPNLLEEMTRVRAQVDKGKHQFVIVSAPSGGGKGTVGGALEVRGFSRLPRVTTRLPRPGEVDGESYVFITGASDEERKAKYEERRLKGEFIGQSAMGAPVETHGEYRGTSAIIFQEKIDRGEKFYIEGSAAAYQEFLDDRVVRRTKPLSVFLLPPSFEVLEARLRGREDTIDEVEIRERLAAAVEHLGKTKAYHYDAYYVNNDFNRTAEVIAVDY